MSDCCRENERPVTGLGWGEHCREYTTSENRMMLDGSPPDHFVLFCDHFDPLTRYGHGTGRKEGMRVPQRDIELMRLCSESITPDGWWPSRTPGTCALCPGRICLHELKAPRMQKLNVDIYDVMLYG